MKRNYKEYKLIDNCFIDYSMTLKSKGKVRLFWYIIWNTEDCNISIYMTNYSKISEVCNLDWRSAKSALSYFVKIGIIETDHVSGHDFNIIFDREKAREIVLSALKGD